jgi:hypothetical protein
VPPGEGVGGGLEGGDPDDAGDVGAQPGDGGFRLFELAQDVLGVLDERFG